MLKFMMFVVFLASGSISLADEIDWPDLSTIDSISGRAATEADMETGSAAFVIKVDGQPAGEPVPIKIPQYAYHVDGDVRTPVVIIQAEANSGIEAVGFKNIESHAIGAGLISEFEFLGTEVPN